MESLKNNIRNILMDEHIRCEFNTDEVDIGDIGYKSLIQKGDLDAKIDAIISLIKRNGIGKL